LYQSPDEAGSFQFCLDDLFDQREHPGFSLKQICLWTESLNELDKAFSGIFRTFRRKKWSLWSVMKEF